MNTSILSSIRWIISKHGENILADPVRLKPLFKNATANEPKEDRNAFGRCIEFGCYNEMKKARIIDQRIEIKTKLLRNLHKKTKIEKKKCCEALDILDVIIFNNIVNPKPDFDIKQVMMSYYTIAHTKLNKLFSKINKSNRKYIIITSSAILLTLITVNFIIPGIKNQTNNTTSNLIEDVNNIDLQRIIEHQEELNEQIERLRKQLEANQNANTQIPSQGLTGQEQLIQRLNNELLMEMLATKRHGMIDIGGRVLVNIVPVNYKNNNFRLNISNIKNTVNEAVDIIKQHAIRNNQNLTIDVIYDNGTNGRYLTLQNSTEAIHQYQRFKNNRYDFTVLVFVIDRVERSYIIRRSDYSHAILWFKEQSGHSSRTLVHEIYHAFGAEDLYYEKGVVPQEVETNFVTLVGNSIMLSSQRSTALDPINAWLIGWNKRPEPWYAWFVDKRDTTNIDFY